MRVLAALPATAAETARVAPESEPAEGGEAACWAHLVCPDCGAITSEGHRSGCPAGPEAGPGTETGA